MFCARSLMLASTLPGTTKAIIEVSASVVEATCVSTRSMLSLSEMSCSPSALLANVKPSVDAFISSFTLRVSAFTKRSSERGLRLEPSSDVRMLRIAPLTSKPVCPDFSVMRLNATLSMLKSAFILLIVVRSGK